MFRILIVENSTDYRHSLGEMLRERYPCTHIDEAEDGTEALNRVSRCPPQFIFVDIKLPDINGLDLTRAIKARHGSIVIAVISAYDIPEYCDAALSSGANYFVSLNTATGADIAAMVDTAFPVVCG